MNTVVIGVSGETTSHSTTLPKDGNQVSGYSREEVNVRFMRAMETGKPQGAYRSFENTAELWRTISPKRWDVLKAMTGAGALSLREVARRVHRDVKGVHNDVHALQNAGLLEKAFVHETHEKYEQIKIHIAINAISR